MVGLTHSSVINLLSVVGIIGINSGVVVGGTYNSVVVGIMVVVGITVEVGNVGNTVVVKYGVVMGGNVSSPTGIHI